MNKKHCEIEGCNNLEYMDRLCRFHFNYTYGDKKPVGTKGTSNYRWHGGTSQYPDHYELKKIRLQVLEEENHTCHYCGNPTNEIHHKDGLKDNHSRENLTACCHSCNLKFAGNKKTSKFIRLYGKTLNEIAKDLGLKEHQVHYLHKKKKLKTLM